MSYDVIVYGPLFCDLIFTDLPGMPELGKEIFAQDFTVAIGGSAIVAGALHRLGARVGLIAELGNDPISALARNLIDGIGFDRALIREHPNPLPQITMALSFPHDRAFVTRFQRPDRPPDLAAILHDHPARHLHISSFLAAMETPDAPQITHDAGMTVSFDPGWDEDALRTSEVNELIKQVDLFLPSKSELLHISGKANFEGALAAVSSTMQDGIIIMKDGSAGSRAYSSTLSEHVPALPVTPIDTTGAGDAFDAGFLHAYVQGEPLKACMQYGNVCGALATTAAGGATATPVSSEVEEWLSRLPL